VDKWTLTVSPGSGIVFERNFTKILLKFLGNMGQRVKHIKIDISLKKKWFHI
jgi:hypothetical protein